MKRKLALLLGVVGLVLGGCVVREPYGYRRYDRYHRYHPNPYNHGP